MDSLRWVDTTYAEKHKNEDHSKLRPAYYPNLRQYAIKDGNAQTGALATRYNGALPNLGGYTPMQKEGAIILGIGGDNSNGSVGSFFEGAMTAGYPSDTTENAVQTNVVSVGYTKSTTFPVNGSTYRLTNVNNGKVLDAVNCGTRRAGRQA